MCLCKLVIIENLSDLNKKKKIGENIKMFTQKLEGVFFKKG